MKLSLLIMVTTAVCTMHAAAQSTFKYTNPIPVEPMRDYFILRDGDTYYLTGTSAPFWEQEKKPFPGVKLFSSKNLIDWKDEGVLLAPEPGRWFQRRFWAPEIHKINGKFWLTVNCIVEGQKGDPQAVVLASAEKVTGPYTVATPDKPLTGGNDASLFQDDDGKVYLFRSGLNAIEVDLANATTVGESFVVAKKGEEGEWDGQPKAGPGVGMEGPCVIKKDGTYYCFYSSWARGYEVGYLTATNVKGPWTKSPENPIWGAQDETWAKRYHAKYTQSPNVPFGQVGHGSPFPGPDGRWWIVGHGYLKTADKYHPGLCIDPLDFVDGKVKTKLTWTEQTVECK